MGIVNEFFLQSVEGPRREVSIQDAISIALGGGRVHFSKRLAPAITICNGRLFAGEEYVFCSDINIYENWRRLDLVAKTYNVPLSLLNESGNNVIWCSDDPEKVQYGGELMPMEAAYKIAKVHRDEMARQWAIDHGLVRRNPKEWLRDMKRNVKWRWYDIRRKIVKSK